MRGISRLYGFREPNIDEARSQIEKALEIELSPHESFYHGGDYYLLREADLELILQLNYDILDQDLAEVEFPESRVLLYLDGDERAEKIAGLLRARLTDATLLRSISYQGFAKT